MSLAECEFTTGRRKRGGGCGGASAGPGGTELGITTGGREQLVVRALIDDQALLQPQPPIRGCPMRHPVGPHHAPPPRRHRVYRPPAPPPPRRARPPRAPRP